MLPRNQPESTTSAVLTAEQQAPQLQKLHITISATLPTTMCILQLTLYTCTHPGSSTDTVLTPCRPLPYIPCPSPTLKPSPYPAADLCPNCQSQHANKNVNRMYWIHQQLEAGDPEIVWAYGVVSRAHSEAAKTAGGDRGELRRIWKSGLHEGEGEQVEVKRAWGVLVGRVREATRGKGEDKKEAMVSNVAE